MARRYRDVIANSDCYRPMCGKHHRLFDSLASMQSKVIEEPIPF